MFIKKDETTYEFDCGDNRFIISEQFILLGVVQLKICDRRYIFLMQNDVHIASILKCYYRQYIDTLLL